MKKVIFIALSMLILVSFYSPAADLSVPELELITRGYMSGGSFLLGTRGKVDFLVAGGYKFGGRVLVGFESNDLDDPAADKSLQLKGAYVILRDAFGLPVDVTYFTGINDTFATGNLFPSFFGSKPIASRFNGFFYFPEPAQVQYNGIHTVSGTGFKLSTTFNSTSNLSALYIYQDSYLGSGTYSLDLYTAVNTELFKFEGFLGMTYPAESSGYYRGGLLLYYDTGQGGEFLTQIGVPRWDLLDPFAIDLFYFLFEPRVNFGFFSIILTLFWHPEYYLQTATSELGSADINANFQFGKPDSSIFSGGIEAQLGLSTTASQQFRAVISPYFSTVTSGVIWDFKVNAQVFPFSLANLAEVFVGVRAEF
ncbi:MAG: hypothetical protein HN368_14225 [Spirochaetales bacterium]|jgi:hypothetical protein|nr:hypothetical protein [Spirochaetales bacterium]